MNENPYYLGCTRSCPLTSYTWNQSNATYGQNFVGSNVPPTVQSVNALNPFSIQLRIGNEYLPIQPITDIPTLMIELEKSVHYVSDITKSILTDLYSRLSEQQIIFPLQTLLVVVRQQQNTISYKTMDF